MANVTVKLFGVLRVDTQLPASKISANTVEDIFGILNTKVDEIFAEKIKENPRLVHPDQLSFKDALVFINGDRCSKKKTILKDGDEIWLLSPASGG
ncbi:MAG: MoaD/ThiS family protein [Lachnospiraceae bacterium]|nr:MoaD/ThiS family protein [Lachnospiraceae bacterium]